MPGAGTIPRFSWPQLITRGASDMITFEERPAGAWEPPLWGTVLGAQGASEESDFFHRDNGSDQDFANGLQTALREGSAAGPNGWTYSVDINDNGTYTIYSDAGGAQRLFRLRWDLSWLNSNLYGFTSITYTAANLTGTRWEITSPNQAANLWLPEQAYTDDTEEIPIHHAIQAVSMSGRRRTQRWGLGRAFREVFCDFLPPNKIFIAEEDRVNEAFERFYLHAASGGRFEFTRHWTNPLLKSPDGVYVISDDKWLNGWPVAIPSGMIRLYDVRFPMNVHVP